MGNVTFTYQIRLMASLYQIHLRDRLEWLWQNQHGDLVGARSVRDASGVRYGIIDGTLCNWATGQALKLVCVDYRYPSETVSYVVSTHNTPLRFGPFRFTTKTYWSA